MLLTGTPLQNSVEELFSLLNFLEPQQFPSETAFLEEFGDLKTEEQVPRRVRLVTSYRSLAQVTTPGTHSDVLCRSEQDPSLLKGLPLARGSAACKVLTEPMGQCCFGERRPACAKARLCSLCVSTLLLACLSSSAHPEHPPGLFPRPEGE